MAAHSEVEKKVNNYYETDNVHNHYTKLWGKGNIHFGYFPNIANPSVAQPSYEDAATLLSQRMCMQGGINSKSVVLDLGCGYGKPACDVALATGAKVVGIDLSSSHISEANKIVREINSKRSKSEQIDVTFYVGSFTKYPEEVEQMQFTHVFTQAAFCHAHKDLYDVVRKGTARLQQNGVFIINDFLCNQGAGADTRKYVWDRMGFPYLISSDDYFRVLKGSGLQLMLYENLNEHLWLSYKILAERGRKNGFEELAYSYEKSCESIEKDESGMVTIVARKGNSKLFSSKM